MQKFDCLSSPIFGPHLLEASAGTGKTFSIEHIFVRLLLESKEDPIELEQILVVTFTQNSARELKARIRKSLDQAARALRGAAEVPLWNYLKPFAESKEAIRRLDDALCLFDRCQIFTIHGFCYRMLQEFAFEANGRFFCADLEKKTTQQMGSVLRRFLEKGPPLHALVPEQISLLLPSYESVGELGRFILKAPKRSDSASFEELFQRYGSALKTWMGEPVEWEKLKEDFYKVSPGYCAGVKGDWEGQIEALARSFLDHTDPLPFRKLIGERGTLFDFLHPSNRKKRPLADRSLHYPSFFDWTIEHLRPILQEASDPKKIFSTLVNNWKKVAEASFQQEDLVDPDAILHQMRQSIETAAFSMRVRRKYAAVMIDEFQDTDPVQWEIFRTLFLYRLTERGIDLPCPLRAFYLVGDPKQSIYRFRNADVYTYFSARTFLGESNLYYLDTNFRSSQPLVSVLNALFHRPWLPLPKLNRMISCFPVQSSANVAGDLPDGKGALHWILGEPSFEETFLPFAINEIEQLLPHVAGFSSFAILVKDRYQAKQAQELLQKRGIPVLVKSHQLLGQTPVFKALRELFSAIAFPHDTRREKVVQMGLFAQAALAHSLPKWKSALEEKGLVSFFHLFLQGRVLPFENDIKPILEKLFEWEHREGFSFEGLERFFQEVESAEIEIPQELSGGSEGVQVLTLHISKGLEFEIVFALAVASTHRETEESEELDAEKLRQLYVAMTRAKKRLYVPLSLAKKKPRSPLTPIELFFQQLELEEGSHLSYLQKLAQRESSTFEEIPSPFPLPPPPNINFCEKEIREPPHQPVSYLPSQVYSFTSLSRKKESRTSFPQVTSDTLPLGAETGIAIHRIFERLFSSPRPVWRDEPSIQSLVSKELQFSSLTPWEGEIQQMVQKALAQPLFDGKRSFALRDLEPQQLLVEMEFFYLLSPHFMKGFIDLIFSVGDKYYVLDWKTNWRGESSLQEIMDTHDYWFQAILYAEALKRHLKSFIDLPFEQIFGGVFYFFIRNGEYLHFFPDIQQVGQYRGQ